jgi:hypothetical protein
MDKIKIKKTFLSLSLSLSLSLTHITVLCFFFWITSEMRSELKHTKECVAWITWKNIKVTFGFYCNFLLLYSSQFSFFSVLFCSFSRLRSYSLISCLRFFKREKLLLFFAVCRMTMLYDCWFFLVKCSYILLLVVSFICEL